MRVILGLFAAWALNCLPARGQLVMNTGDVFGYEFSSLPYSGRFELNPRDPGWDRWTFSGRFQEGTVLRVEMFGNSLHEQPLFWHEFPLIGLSAITDSYFAIPATAAWADLRGAVRLTVVSGSASICDMHVTALVHVEGPPRGWDAYTASILPVPEPSTFALLGLTLAFSAFSLAYRKRQSGAALQ